MYMYMYMQLGQGQGEGCKINKILILGLSSHSHHYFFITWFYNHCSSKRSFENLYAQSLANTLFVFPLPPPMDNQSIKNIAYFNLILTGT